MLNHVIYPAEIHISMDHSEASQFLVAGCACVSGRPCCAARPRSGRCRQLKKIPIFLSILYGSSYIFLDLLRKSLYIDPIWIQSYLRKYGWGLISAVPSHLWQNRALQADTLMAPAVEPVEPAEPDGKPSI